MRAEYHCHTEFSDDSNTLMQDQIERAIELGLDEICFTDHVDYGVKKDWNEEGIIFRYPDRKAYLDRVPLTNVNYEEYFSKIQRMKVYYGKDITIKTGLEFGMQTHTVEKYREILRKYGDKLDFVLLSVHQVNDQEFWTGDFMEGKSQLQYNLDYYNELLSLVKTFDDYDILAHVDMICRYDPCGPIELEKIKDVLTEIFKIVIEKGKGIEINTSSWKYGLKDTTPSRDILKLYYSLGGRVITIGSDAHLTEYLADHFDDAIAVLKEIGFTEFYTYTKHHKEAHSL